MKKIFIVSIFLIILDFITKLFIVNFLKNDVFLVSNIFYLTFVTNTGTFWGLFSDANMFFIILSLVILSILIYIIIKKINLNKINKYLYSLIISGVRGYVVDFIGIRIFDYSFPIFNLADVYIVIGVLLFMIIGDKNEIRWICKK